MLSQCLRESGFPAQWTDAVQILPMGGAISIPTNVRFQVTFLKEPSCPEP